MANYNSTSGLWKTEIGSYYTKDNFAYIVTTNPYEKIGMAKPLRVKQIYGEQSIEDIVEDIYIN